MEKTELNHLRDMTLDEYKLHRRELLEKAFPISTLIRVYIAVFATMALLEWAWIIFSLRWE